MKIIILFSMILLLWYGIFGARAHHQNHHQQYQCYPPFSCAKSEYNFCSYYNCNINNICMCSNPTPNCNHNPVCPTPATVPPTPYCDCVNPVDPCLRNPNCIPPTLPPTTQLPYCLCGYPVHPCIHNPSCTTTTAPTTKIPYCDCNSPIHPCIRNPYCPTTIPPTRPPLPICDCENPVDPCIRNTQCQTTTVPLCDCTSPQYPCMGNPYCPTTTPQPCICPPNKPCPTMPPCTTVGTTPTTILKFCDCNSPVFPCIPNPSCRTVTPANCQNNCCTNKCQQQQTCTHNCQKQQTCTHNCQQQQTITHNVQQYCHCNNPVQPCRVNPVCKNICNPTYQNCHAPKPMQCPPQESICHTHKYYSRSCSSYQSCSTGHKCCYDACHSTATCQKGVIAKHRYHRNIQTNITKTVDDPHLNVTVILRKYDDHSVHTVVSDELLHMKIELMNLIDVEIIPYLANLNCKLGRINCLSGRALECLKESQILPEESQESQVKILSMTSCLTQTATVLKDKKEEGSLEHIKKCIKAQELKWEPVRICMHQETHRSETEKITFKNETMVQQQPSLFWLINGELYPMTFKPKDLTRTICKMFKIRGIFPDICFIYVRTRSLVF